MSTLCRGRGRICTVDDEMGVCDGLGERGRFLQLYLDS